MLNRPFATKLLHLRGRGLRVPHQETGQFVTSTAHRTTVQSGHALGQAGNDRAQRAAKGPSRIKHSSVLRALRPIISDQAVDRAEVAQTDTGETT